MKLRFAFAASTEGLMKNRHFGDADKYLIYEQSENGLICTGEIENRNKDLPHGVKNKAEVIAEDLAQKDIQVVVSRQFGKNISRINHFFIPVIVQQDDPQSASEVLFKHLHWLEDAWNHKKEDGYKLFLIEQGILKVPVKKL